MVELSAYGQQFELGSKSAEIKYTKQVSDIFDLAVVASSYTNGFSIPKTPNNTQIMNQLGIGPDGYKISSKVNTWNEFFGDRTDLELVKIAVYLRVRLIFDPPQNAFLVTAIKEQITEYDWRIELNHIRPVDVEVVDGE